MDFSADSCQITTSGLAAFKLGIRFAQKFQYGVISFDSSLKMPFIFNFSQLYTLYRFFYLNLKIPITEVTHYSLGDSFDIFTRKRRILLQSDYLIRGSWKKIVQSEWFLQTKDY